MTTHSIENNKEKEVVQDYEEKKAQTRKLRQKRLKKAFVVLFSLTLFFLITTLYSQYQIYILKKTEESKKVSSFEILSDPRVIVEAVSKHVLLPNAVPQIAAVQDAKKLSASQVFFKEALNGDIVLVYTSMIILYRPSLDIVVAVGDISGERK